MESSAEFELSSGTRCLAMYTASGFVTELEYAPRMRGTPELMNCSATVSAVFALDVSS